MSKFCHDCGIDTTPTIRGRGVKGRWEWYLVHDDLWAEAGMTAGYLCIGCLEKRIGRELKPQDFAPLPINEASTLDTPRIQARLGYAKAVHTVELALKEIK